MIVGPSPNGIEFAGKRTTPALVVPRPGVISRRHCADREMMMPQPALKPGH